MGKILTTQSRVFHVTGPPGTGKTTALARYARDAASARGGESVVIASLTRAAASEIAARDIPVPRQHIGTLHSLCFHALGRPQIAEKHLDEWNALHPEYRLSDGDADVDEPGDDRHGRATNGDHMRDQANLFRHRRTPMDLWPISVAAFHRAWQEWLDETGRVDFTGLLEIAAEHVAHAPGNPEVMIGDECQDWSALEAHLFRDVWGKHAETVIMAADPDQAIYEWRGANPRIFLDHPVPSQNERVLRQSYRVSRAVHELAMRIISRISERAQVEYLPRDADGSVEQASATWRYPEPLLPMLEEAAAGGPTVMILAPCSFALSPVIQMLRKRAIPFWNPYRRKRGDWNPIQHGDTKRTTAVDRVLSFLRMDPKTWGSDTREWTPEDLAQWMKPLRADGVLTRGAKERIKVDFNVRRSFGDLFVGGLASEHAVAALDGDLKWYRDHLLPRDARTMSFAIDVAAKHGGARLREEPRVVVGTIHSVKGGQSDTVVLFPDLSREAAREATTPRGRDALLRLAYVAVTRARDRVVLARPASPFYLRTT